MSVDYRTHRQKWRARISVNRKRIDLGEFNTRDLAQAAYDAALAEYGPQRVLKDRRKSDPAKRFWAKTVRNERGCLIWQGATDKDGYGKYQLNGGGRQKHVRAHRYAFFLANGRWPNDLALHSCDTPSCVNPDHLGDGDQSKNMRDCVARGRRKPGGTTSAEAKT